MGTPKKTAGRAAASSRTAKGAAKVSKPAAAAATKSKTKTKARAAGPAPVDATTAASATEDIEVEGSERFYEQYLPAARAIAENDVIPFRSDTSLAFRNVNKAMNAIAGTDMPALFKRKLPEEDLTAYRALPDLCQAVAYAFGLVGHSNALAIRPKLKEGMALRMKLFRAADALVDAGIFPADQVEELHKGQGEIDAAADLSGLAALFRKFQTKTRGQTHIKKADVSRAYALGAELTSLLQPKTAKRERRADVKAAADVRDRMWTLLATRYDKLGDVCGYLFGRAKSETLVPALMSHHATTSNRIKANKAKRAAKGGGGTGGGSGGGATGSGGGAASGAAGSTK